MKKLHLFFSLILFSLIFSTSLLSQENNNLEFDAFQYRNIGAFRTSAWVGDIAVPENPGLEHKYTFYIAARNGGVWKTINNGTTFQCISDDLGVTAIGEITIAPSNPDILWIGTGEDFNCRSSYYGNGVWKSNDAGKTWENMGLKDSHHISRIIIHPENPDIVWLASMGHLFTENEERGVFKTTNGGKTWKKILYIDEATGIIDMSINISNPNILYATSYEKIRNAWTYEPGGEKSRIYKTIDGGENWNMLTNGLPSGSLGRIGIDIHRSNPDILYVIIQNLNLKPGTDPNAEVAFDEFTDGSFDNLIGGEAYRTDDGGLSWRKINDAEEIDLSGKAAYSFNKIFVDPADPDKVYIIGSGMYYTLDGGKTWPRGRRQNLFRTNFGDNRSFWIDPNDPKHIMLGSDGGIYSSWDGGESMYHYYQIPLGEIYMVEVDNAKPYNIYIGLQDHEVWKGPSNSWSGQITNKDWVIVGMWDGMYTKVDPTDNKWLYFTSQFGAHHRENQAIGERTNITPKAPDGEDFYRFTWTTPIVISPHNSSIIYAGAQKLLRSSDRGDNWKAISPDLTDNNKEKIAGTGHMMHCTITTISESAVKPGVIWVGTDDGHIHMTKDNGKTWLELTEKITTLGAPADRWVSRIITSNYSAGKAYVTKSGYRNDDFKAYVYKTDDYGITWTDISSNLPDYPVNVIFEDKKNPELLFLGNDNGVYFSLDDGKYWKSLKVNMPPVVVRDLLVHPTENDLVVGTYGRAAWITDISPLQQFSKKIQEKDYYLFNIDPKPLMNYSQQAQWGNYHMTGSNHLSTPNERSGLEIWYYFQEKPDDNAVIKIFNENSKQVFTEPVNIKKGINKIYWNPRRSEPGKYTIILSHNGVDIKKEGILEPRILYPVLNYK